MIIIDTNVISEVVKPGRSQAVVSWLDSQITETLFMTAPGLSELRLGIECLPGGRRKKALSAELDALVANFFGGRILPFDKPAAIEFGVLIAAARAAGRSVSVTDGQIGSIASVHKFSVATRDTAPFIALGVSVIDPWKL